MSARRRRLRLAAATALVVAAGIAALGLWLGHGAPVAQGATSTAPTVALTVPTTTESSCSCLRGTVPISATPTASSGRTIVSVEFQTSPAGTGNWTSIGTVASAPYSLDFDTTTVDPGDYDVRAIATDDTGETGTATVLDRVIANNATYVALADPGSVLHGTVHLQATPESGGFFPSLVTFERSPAGTENWTTIATAEPELDSDGYRTGKFVTELDTAALADGSYDLRVTATDDSGDLFVATPQRARLVDNTPPTSTLSNPGGPLDGVVTLTAAVQDPMSGVAAVRFERAPAGSGTWTSFGADTKAPYERSLDTRLLENGRYDLRVVATDRAGNKAPSPVVADVAVSNPSRTAFDKLSIENAVAPASNISLLGEVADSPQHETWAYGLTSAPPALVDGARLPYTVPGENQLVLLRYTDRGGWQIADVLRDADGPAFPQIAGATLAVAGQMAPSGEAWIVVSQRKSAQPTPEVGVFHRSPGGQFRLDPVATGALKPMMGGLRGVDGADLRLGQTATGQVYGTLRVPNQPSRPLAVTPPGGGAKVTIATQLDYGALVDGTWATRTATLPAGFAPRANELVGLAALDPTGAGSGWGALSRSTTKVARPLMLGRFDGGGWQFTSTELDALDLTDDFSAAPLLAAQPQDVRADSSGVWAGASVTPGKPGNVVVARYDSPSDQVSGSWCGPGLPRASLGCASPLDADHPAAVPDRVFDTSEGKVGLALRTNSLGVFAHGDWTAVAAPGFRAGTGKALFTAPDEGWLVGANAIGRVTSKPLTNELAPWPQPNRSPLVSVALPPGSQGGTDQSGALAVGLDGVALRYDSAAGWLVQATPSRARRVALRGVAFSGPSSAFAVGQLGTILRWDGSSWSEDPQSVGVTQAQLNAVAFGSNGQGWAVGAFGTLLHFDGQSWSLEKPPAEDEAANITSVTVAGPDVFAVAGGNLIMRGAGGVWHPVDPADLPTPAPVAGDFRLVSGLPDGGVVVAGRSVVMVRQHASQAFDYSAQPLEGVAVALAAFRDGSGDVRAFVSLAPPVTDVNGTNTHDVAGFPPGDGELMRETADGWQDLSRAQYPAGNTLGDGAVKEDPVLAVATNPSGTSAWAVGGYAGTLTASRLGTDVVLPARPAGWRTASLWRYDTSGSAASPALGSADVTLPAQPNTVSFAFFSSSLCKSQCAAVRDAQPDVNMRAAAREIAAFAAQPGGPAFAMLGGNARGPIEDTDYKLGNGAIDLANLPALLSPLNGLPLFAAYGPRDSVPTSANPAQPWADAFAQAPAPFGRGAAASGIDPAGSGATTGAVHRYYAFDANQNGGRLRVIVLDNSQGSLESSAPGQTAWLDDRLADAGAAALPVVVITSRPLRSSASGADSDGAALGSKLVNAGVLAVFTTSGTAYRSQINRRALIPETADPNVPQIPEYEGATLGYQQAQNNGVLWYSVSVDTAARTVDVKAIPVVDSLAIKPLAGLRVARSSTLQFEAVGRRPVGTLATPPNDDTFPGFDNYVGIPAANCSGCIGPSYKFTSSDPTIGNFVVPSGPGSRYPKLDSKGKPTVSAASGLFCAFNSGDTTITVTSGLLSASLPVTVEPGDIGRPCGTVFRAGVQRVIIVPNSHQVSRNTSPSGAAAPPPPPAAAPVNTALPKIVLRVPPPPRPAPKAAAQPRPAAKPAAAPASPPAPAPLPPAPVAPPLSPLITVPPVPPTAQPIPPGGAAGASSPSAARRKEKVHKHAQQSAYVTRPAGASGADWFFPAVGGAGLLAMMLAAGGMKRDPRPRPVPVLLREQRAPTSRKERWR